MKHTIVVNLIGGPGSGKSTTAAGLFYNLKKLGINCEMALEYAKDKVYEESFKTMDDQLYIFGKQYHLMWRLKNLVDVIITDSPLLLSIYYNKTKSNYFEDLIVEQYNKFNNMLYILKRDNIEFKQEGRIQNEEESKHIDMEVKNILDRNNISYIEISTLDAIEKITEDVVNKLNDNRCCNNCWTKNCEHYNEYFENGLCEKYLRNKSQESPLPLGMG